MPIFREKTFDEYRSKYSIPEKGDVHFCGNIGITDIYDEAAYFQDSNIVWIDNDASIVLNSYLRYCYERNRGKHLRAERFRDCTTTI